MRSRKCPSKIIIINIKETNKIKKMPQTDLVPVSLTPQQGVHPLVTRETTQQTQTKKSKNENTK